MAVEIRVILLLDAFSQKADMDRLRAELSISPPNKS
jgi:hypothetical protein